MKIYTKTGDLGTTSLIGKRVLKTNICVEINGQIDELSALMSVTKCYLKDKEILSLFENIQNDFVEIMGFIAGNKAFKIDLKKKINKFEQIIDNLSTRKEKLNSFILPNNDLKSCYLNYTRTVCRRVERKVVETKNSLLISYFNRLSDLFFVLSYVL